MREKQQARIEQRQIQSHYLGAHFISSARYNGVIIHG